jgi:hypothetical protein
MQTSNDLGHPLFAIEREGRLARSCGTFSGCNPYLHRGRFAASSVGVETDWFRNCDAWWRGWDVEDARRRSADDSAWPPFAASDFQSSCPEKSALLQSLADREPGIRNLARLAA